MAMLHAARIQRGGATIETAIVLPVFMMAVLALSSLIGYPAAWLRVETAVCDATRLLASGGYAAQLCGLLTVRGDADALAQGRSRLFSEGWLRIWPPAHSMAEPPPSRLIACSHPQNFISRANSANDMPTDTPARRPSATTKK